MSIRENLPNPAGFQLRQGRRRPVQAHGTHVRRRRSRMGEPHESALLSRTVEAERGQSLPFKKSLTSQALPQQIEQIPAKESEVRHTSPDLS